MYELLAGRIRTLRLTAEIDLFELESDRLVWRPPSSQAFLHRRRITIEQSLSSEADWVTPH